VQALPLVSLAAADWGTNIFAGDFGATRSAAPMARARGHMDHEEFQDHTSTMPTWQAHRYGPAPSQRSVEVNAVSAQISS
jgi:hypothetical protein